MSLKCLYMVIILSRVHVVYSEEETGLDHNVVGDLCNSFEGARNVIYGNFCYTVHYDRLTWSAAVNDCEAEGGQLFKADDKKKMAAVFKNDVVLRIWTGAKERDGDFYWLDGTQFYYHRNVLEKAVTDFVSWFSTKMSCMAVDIGYPTASGVDYSWGGQDCGMPYTYVCEHDIYGASTQKSTPEDVSPTTKATTPQFSDLVPMIQDPQNVRTAKVSRIINQHYLIQDDPLFEKRTFSTTMCSRLCLHICRVFNYNAQTGQCRGFAYTRNKLLGVKNSAWQAWEIVPLGNLS